MDHTRSDQEVAGVITRNRPFDVETFGTTTVNVTDTLGNTVPINFTRPTLRYLYLEVTVTQGEGIPTTSDFATGIANAVGALSRDGGDGELVPGQDSYRIAVAETKILVGDASRVTVTLV